MKGHPMRDSTTFFVSDEDRRSYRRWMRTVVIVYGGILLVALGSTMLRSHQRADEIAANVRMESGLTIDLAHFNR